MRRVAFLGSLHCTPSTCPLLFVTARSMYATEHGGHVARALHEIVVQFFSMHFSGAVPLALERSLGEAAQHGVHRCVQACKLLPKLLTQELEAVPGNLRCSEREARGCECL